MPPLAERLIIESFAGIEHLDLDVRPFTVLIGPQSVGKSIVARLLYFFKTAPRNLYVAAFKDDIPTFEEAYLARFFEAVPMLSHQQGSARITHQTGGLDVTLAYSGKLGAAWEVDAPPKLREAYETVVKEIQEEDREEEISGARDFASRVYQASVSRLWPVSSIPPRFIPGGRSYFAQIENDVGSYIESAEIDPFVAEFWSFLLRLKRHQQGMLGTDTKAIQLANGLIGGTYVREGNEDFILTHDGRKLPNWLWSSGQQEVQPLTLLLRHYSEGNLSPAAIFIEEPEAHLFPASQRAVTELIALAYNARQPGMQMFLTTHSPYILTTINNLLLAGQLYQRPLSNAQQEILAKAVSRDCALLPGELGAFYMERSGCRSIIDPETNLIEASAIDEVSDDLNQQFDTLLNIRAE